ncbi:MAG TPA: RHS repeat-associated core domain-containing protein, partial [Mariniflexile sp.]
AQVFLFMKTENETGYFTFVDSKTIATTTGWSLIEKTFLVPANIKKLNIRLDNNTTGILWFDDVRIRKTSDAIPQERELNVSYNAFKSPYEITETGVDKISFTYNQLGNRSSMFYGGLQTDKMQRQYRKHYSADGSMEIKHNTSTGAVEFVTYMGGDGYTAPVVLKSNGTTQEYLYLHRDYLSSIVAITNQAGQVVEKRLFDAWGEVIKVVDGQGTILSAFAVLDRGYTGHEHLKSVGLIHMNGRLYDAKLHRFLQPDNYVQDPNNTQNFNRYGYVLNNPLKYTDFSGEKWKITWNDIFAAAQIVVGVVLTVVSSGTLAYVGGALITAGVSHFAATYNEYKQTGDWASASKNQGVLFFDISFNTDFGYGKDKQNGIVYDEPIVKPKSDVGGSLPCTGDCDGWLATEYIGPTSASIFYRNQSAVDMVDLAARFHDAGYFKEGADGVNGALFNLNVLKYDKELLYLSEYTLNGYFSGRKDIVTNRPISLATAGRAFAVFGAFGPIVVGKSISLGIQNGIQSVRSLPDALSSFSSQTGYYLNNFNYFYNQQRY